MEVGRRKRRRIEKNSKEKGFALLNSNGILFCLHFQPVDSVLRESRNFN